jgi:hypothetical protein
MTAPNDVHSSMREGRRKAGGLRIVQKDHVPGLDQADHASGVSLTDPGVVGLLVDTEVALVTGGPVQPIVDTLGYGEELGIAAHDKPMHIKARIEGITDEHLEHFGNPAALRRRTDVPDRPTSEISASRCRGTHEISVSFSPDERFKVGQGAAGHGNLADRIPLG